MIADLPVVDVPAFEALGTALDVAPPAAEVALPATPPAADVALLRAFVAEEAPDAAVLAPPAAALLAPVELPEAGQLATGGSVTPTLNSL